MFDFKLSHWRSRDAQDVTGLKRALFERIKMRSIARVAQRPLHVSIEGNRVKRGLAAGCLFLWYLSFGQTKERYLLSGNPRLGCPAENGHKIQPRSDHQICRPKEPTYKTQKTGFQPTQE